MQPSASGFEREARAISALSHPHICTLYDIGNHGGVEFLVMEYLDGESLDTRLSRGPLPIDQVFRHGVEIARALEQAHKQGIVHRDLKPGNIIFQERRQAARLRFGQSGPPGTEPGSIAHGAMTSPGPSLPYS